MNSQQNREVSLKTATNNQEANNSLNDWQKLPDFIKQYPQFNMTQMRWLMLHRETNGLSKCTRKIGKPIYIHAPSFLEWIFNKNN